MLADFVDFLSAYPVLITICWYVFSLPTFLICTQISITNVILYIKSQHVVSVPLAATTYALTYMGERVN